MAEDALPRAEGEDYDLSFGRSVLPDPATPAHKQGESSPSKIKTREYEDAVALALFADDVKPESASSLGIMEALEEVVSTPRREVKAGGNTSVVYLTDLSLICGRRFANKSIFCIKLETDCGVAHKGGNFYDRKDSNMYGLYIIGSDCTSDQAICDPYLPACAATEEQLREYPTRNKTKAELAKLFSVSTASSVALSCTDAGEEVGALKAALLAKTPGRPKSKNLALPKINMFPLKPDPSRLESWKANLGTDFIVHSQDCQESIRNFFRDWPVFLKKVDSQHDALSTVSANQNWRLINLESTIGVNSREDDDLPLSLWGSVQYVKQMHDEFDEVFDQRAVISCKTYEILKKNISSLLASTASGSTRSHDKLKKDLDIFKLNFSSSVKDSNTLSVNFSNLKKEFSSSMSKIGTSLKHFKDDIGILSATVNRSSTLPAVGNSSNLSLSPQVNGSDLQDKLNLLEVKLKALMSTDSHNKEAVRICGLTFDSPADLEAWQIKNTPASLPFGGFTNFFILLARVSTGHRSQSDTLKNMDLAKKLALSAAECLIIGTF